MRAAIGVSAVLIAVGICEYTSAVAIPHGKWHLTMQQGGAMLGWSSDASSEELDGVVFNCQKRGGPITTSIDLDPSFKAGTRADITLAAGTEKVEVGGPVEDGLNGPMMTVDLQPDRAKTLLIQKSAINVRLHSLQQKVPYVFPAAPRLFERFLKGCGAIP